MTSRSNSPRITPYSERQNKLRSTLHSARLDCLILNAGPSLVYLTGLHFHLSERPVLVIFFPDADPIIVLPELEQEKLKNLAFNIRAFPYGEDPSQWDAIFKNAIGVLNRKKIGVEPRQLRLLEYRLLTKAAPQSQFIPADDVISRLRMFKDEGELLNMRTAVRIAEQALNATLPVIKPGITERNLAAELTLQLYRAGCDPELAFAPIVSAGPNAANPHATPSSRKLTIGDLLVIDWGASYQGYLSDITRTFSLGKLDSDYERICKICLAANEAGRAAAHPGIAAEVIDQAARAVIESSGYGKYFTHRTGHGLGMESHEEPYIRPGNVMLLEPGMTFTIEPGIYLPGRNGVRIEDDVVITTSGAETLTNFPREVIPL